MSTFSANKLILNYCEAFLYKSDVALLESPSGWLNDACLHFYLTILQQQERKDDIKFMDPSVITFLIHQCDDEDLHEFSASFQKECDIYVIPINDGHASGTMWQRPGGGSHWSLLLVVKTDCNNKEYQFRHINSVAGSNMHAAQAVSNVFCRILGSRVTGILKPVKTPQQRNGYDCGLFALGAAEVVANGFISFEDYERDLQQLLGNAQFGMNMRRKILEKVKTLQKLDREC